MKSILMRVSFDFKKLIYKVKAKEALINGKIISCEEITKKISEYIDSEKFWQNEINKK